MTGDIFDQVDQEPAAQAAPTPAAAPAPELPAATPAPQNPPATTDAPKAGPASQGELLLEKLYSHGVMVKVSVGGGDFKKKLTPKDIGKDKKDVPEEIVILGQKRLIKKSSLAELHSIREKAYSLVESHSRESWFGGLRFMTLKSYDKVKDQLEELKKQYFAAADKFIKAYPSLKEEMLKEFPEWADKLAPFYPSVDRVKKSFYFAVDVGNITLANQLTSVLGEAKIAMEKELSKKLNGFLKDTVKDTRQLFLEELQAIKDKIDKGDKVHGKTVKKIGEMIEQAKQMNFVDDTEFVAMLETFKKAWDKDKLNDESLKKKATDDLNAIIAKAGDEKSAEEVVTKYYRGIVV